MTHSCDAALSFPHPLLCQTKQHKQIWKFPQASECQIPLGNTTESPQNAVIALYRQNVLQYVSDGWLCRKASRSVRTLTYFFDDEHLKEESTDEVPMTREECQMMVRNKRCSEGPLTSVASIWTTNKKLYWYFPGGGMHCCQWNQFSVTNCFLTHAKVYKRHGERHTESTAGDVSHCHYMEGGCSLKDGTYLHWEPNKTESYAIIPWKEMPGKMTPGQWLSDDGNLALTFDETELGVDCDRRTVYRSHQGISFRILQKSSFIQSNFHTEQQPTSRTKRSEGIGMVTSELLAASLHALELQMTKTVSFAFHKAMTSTCALMDMVTNTAISHLMTNPTLLMRLLLGHSKLITSSGGQFVEVWPCESIAAGDYHFLPMNKSCTIDISMQFRHLNETFNGYLDPGTNIIQLHSREVDCGHREEVPVSLPTGSLLYSRIGKLTPVQSFHQLLTFAKTTPLELPRVMFHPIVMYRAEEMRSHINMNDIWKTYDQQQRVFRRLGMQTDSRPPEDVAAQTASNMLDVAVEFMETE